MLLEHGAFLFRGKIASSIIARCYITLPRVQRARPAPSWQLAGDAHHVVRAATNVVWRRGAKRKSKIALVDLPQGPISTGLAERVGEDDVPEYPTVVQQAYDNMRKFSHCVLLTRVGGFYELYFEHAEMYGPLLNIKVARKKTSKANVPMAGFPHYQLDRFLKILVQDLNKYVAISEEFPNPVAKKVKSGGLLFDRKVVRIITPGTLIDENFMDPWQSNFLLSIHLDESVAASSLSANEDQDPMKSPVQAVLSNAEVGLAWLDLSSGDFYTQITSVATLPAAIARIGPREVILDTALETLQDSWILSLLEQEGHVVTFHTASQTTTVSDWAPMLEELVSDFDPTKFSSGEVIAGGSLLDYVRTQLQGSSANLQAPIRYVAQDHMSIDRNTLRALEVRTTLRDGRYEGSLLHAVKRTVTQSGTRLLTQRLMAPSFSLPVIHERLNLVSGLLDEPVLHEIIISLLRRTFDTWRLVQKFSFGRGNADDLIELARTIQITNDVAQSIEKHLIAIAESRAESASGEVTSRVEESFRSLLEQLSLHQPMQLAESIINSIDEDGLSQQHRLEDKEAEEMTELARDVVNQEANEEELKQLPRRIQSRTAVSAGNGTSVLVGTQDFWIMQKSASPALEELHGHLDELAQIQTALEERLQNELGIPALSLKWTPNLGHIVHVKGKNADRMASYEGARSVSSSKSTGSYHLSEWTRLGAQIEGTRLRIRSEEQRVLGELRASVVRNLVKLRRNAAVLDELDVACSFATIAREKNLVRPILNPSASFNIVGGRHLVVEGGLAAQGRNFTTNDCFVGEKERIWLITGPNMAGKSTFLRQNALISILAQTGSYVPAEYAEIGLVDKVFTRVGSADNLYQDQSTFMVEMVETAEILKQATPRSFVIMDEVGRGTTPEDGTAVGYACLDHLHRINKCRAVFATHFHALADMTKDFDSLGRYCSDVVETEDGSFAYVHRLRPGVNRQSHALKVARIAGLPKEAVDVAERVLADLKSNTKNKVSLEGRKSPEVLHSRFDGIGKDGRSGEGIPA